ncbi:hypothetical protein CRUP_002172 [Coryphaenoides rupestris]|nr:hypothetical protein CRUP_002172 [Coryphaenoides rupestris]
MLLQLHTPLTFQVVRQPAASGRKYVHQDPEERTSDIMTDHEKWVTLTPAEFSLLQDYAQCKYCMFVSASPEWGGGGGSELSREIDFKGFKVFMQTFLESELPEEFCQHLFLSFSNKGPKPSPSSSDKPKVSGLKLIKGSSTPLKAPPAVALAAPPPLNTVQLKDIVCYLSLMEGGRPEDKLECTCYTSELALAGASGTAASASGARTSPGRVARRRRVATLLFTSTTYVRDSVCSRCCLSPFGSAAGAAPGGGKEQSAQRGPQCGPGLRGGYTCLVAPPR